jgi:hypothetical protein
VKRAASLVVIALGLGCASWTGRPYAKPVELNVPDKRLSLPVRLDLESLRHGILPGDNHSSSARRRAVGEGLAENAERVARAAFRDVAIDVAGRPRLRPRVVVLEIGSGGAGYSNDLYTLILEWALVDDASGSALWIETVGSTSQKVREVVEETMRASLAVLIGSPELRSYGENGVPLPP